MALAIPYLKASVSSITVFNADFSAPLLVVPRSPDLALSVTEGLPRDEELETFGHDRCGVGDPHTAVMIG